jgi:mono/diheme cytochrome c family protein
MSTAVREDSERDSASDPSILRDTKGVAAKVAAAVGLLLIVLAAGALAFVYSGVFDISATNPHAELTHRILTTVKEQSMKRQARNVEVPELDDPEKVHAGFRDYQAMCVTCHNAPGAAPSEISKGLYPQAPDLAESAQRRTPAELYMIIKRGIKMSGMPAWEPTHSGDEIWGVVAFLKVLPGMSAQEYQAAVEYSMAAGKSDEMRH